VGADAHFGWFDDDGGAGGDVVGDPCIAADDGAAADGDVAEDGGAGVDDDVVFDGGVTFETADLAGVGGEGFSAEGDALIELDVPADDGGFTDDDAGAVIGEEVFTDGGAGMDVNTGLVMGVLGHDARDEGDVKAIEDMSETLDGDGEEAGIADDGFFVGVAGGVAFEGGFDVGREDAAEVGEAFDDPAGAAMGVIGAVVFGAGGGAFASIAQAAFDLECEALVEFGDAVAGDVAEVGAGKALIAEVAREDEGEELAGDSDDFFAAGQIEAINVVDATEVVITLDEGIDERVEGVHG